MPRLQFYSYSDQKYHYKSEVPRSLRQYIGVAFDSTGDAMYAKKFFRKYRNYIISQLPTGWDLENWYYNWYAASFVIRDNYNKLYYMSVSDVRYDQDHWIDDILLRTMSHSTDWHGGTNFRTDLLNITKDLLKLQNRRKDI